MNCKQNNDQLALLSEFYLVEIMKVKIRKNKLEIIKINKKY